VHSDESDHRLGPRRTGQGKRPDHLPGSRRARGRTGSRTGLAVAVTGLLLVAGMPFAGAQPTDPAVPSRHQVETAEQRAEDTARSVEEIQADFAAANDELETLGVAAARAAEAYNGAVWRLEQSRKDARRARRKADRAAARSARQRDGIGALVAATYQGGSDLGQVSAYLTSNDADALLDRFAAFKGASGTMQARLDRFRAAHSLQQVFEREAERAVAAADRAEQEAAAARLRAQDAVAAQEAAVSDIAARKDALVRELARAQSISVTLAAQRQDALERRAELRRQRAAERAARAAREREAALAAQRAQEERAAQAAAEAAQAAAAQQAREQAEDARERARDARAEQDAAAQRQQAAQARAQAAQQAEDEAAQAEAEDEAAQAREAQERREERAAREAAAAAQARREAAQARREAAAARREAGQARQEAREARQARRAQLREAREQRREARADRRQARQDRQARGPRRSGGAAQAVAFAMDQLGEPYVWAGAGPDVWDCSGLTAGAWGAAGKYLSHYSVAQYYETSRVSYSQLRPGDLIFWSSNGTPGGIFHVAMYIGNDKMVHAPRTGVPVSIEDVWYWEPPAFFGRV
jgi:peptidoglycan DL-endopeptidase CwlO